MDIKEDDNKDKFQLVELFLVAADIHRTFPATMLTRHDENNQEFFIGTVIIHEGEVIGRAKSQTELERNMDDICKMKLDYGLHSAEGASSEILSTRFIHN